MDIITADNLKPVVSSPTWGSKYLHVHHRNGQKNDNRDSNLAVMCVACHAEQPMRGHMKFTPDYKAFIAQRP